ncbi:nucleoside diphosphate kinase regulator [Escherichia coli]
MSRPTIIINDLDAERIDILLEQPAYAGLPIADALNAELDRAEMCSPEEMPHDVVTMNSRVKFRNLSDGEVRVRTLVYPAKMTDSNTQLSVMAPVGAACWGCALAIPFTGNFRAALQPTLKCWNSEYQPEAARDYLL